VQLRNISEILSGVNLTSGSYDAIRLSASNASAIVNGTSEPVFLPSGNLTILGRFNISPNTTNWVNIDFDLQSSLHITPNGSIVMLPVLLIRHDTGNGIGLNSSSIVVERGQMPQMHESFRCGMNWNGSMMDNFTAPQNMTIGFQGGRLVGSGPGPNMLFLRLKQRIVIGEDAKAFLMNNILTGNSSVNGSSANGTGQIVRNAVVGIRGSPQSGGGNYVTVTCNSVGGCRERIGGQALNATAEWNASAKSPSGTGGLVRLPPGLIGGNSSSYANCRIVYGSVDCDENDSANMTAVPVGINPGGLCRGQC
jgi:hypothetical protein